MFATAIRQDRKGAAAAELSRIKSTVRKYREANAVARLGMPASMPPKQPPTAEERGHPESHGTVVPFMPRQYYDPNFGASAWKMVEGGERGDDSGFRMLVASDLALRERAFRLAYRVYLDCAYTVETEAEFIVSRFDTDPGTLVLLIQDSMGRDAATVSVVLDSPLGLPCDDVHGAEVAALRAQGRRLAEVTRLAVDVAYAGKKSLLVHLFNFLSVYARYAGSTDFVIEVHPRHVNYYRRLLLFQPCGPERRCLRVNGAPARLLKLDLGAQVAEIGMVGGTQGQAHGPCGRTLYSHFCALEQEPRLAAFMRSQQRPMTAEDLRHFRLDSSAIPAGRARLAAGAAGFPDSVECGPISALNDQIKAMSAAVTAGARKICAMDTGAAAPMPS